MVLASPPDPAFALSEVIFGGGAESGAFVFWADTLGAAQEIVYRAGLLDETASPGTTFDLFPFEPQRPLDPAVSETLQLSACAVDEATFACDPTRTAGRAGQPSVLSDPGIRGLVYAVWRDTRNGVGNIRYTRSDLGVRQTAPQLSTLCSDPDMTRVHVSWTPSLSCLSAQGAAGERHRRFYVYYGTDPAGPYLNAANPIEVPGANSFGRSRTAIRFSGVHA